MSTTRPQVPAEPRYSAPSLALRPRPGAGASPRTSLPGEGPAGCAPSAREVANPSVGRVGTGAAFPSSSTFPPAGPPRRACSAVGRTPGAPLESKVGAPFRGRASPVGVRRGEREGLIVGEEQRAAAQPQFPASKAARRHFHPADASPESAWQPPAGAPGGSPLGWALPWLPSVKSRSVCSGSWSFFEKPGLQKYVNLKKDCTPHPHPTPIECRHLGIKCQIRNQQKSFFPPPIIVHHL